jgi:hypothetical protein
MLNKESLSARYPDLLDGQDHADLLALAGDLDAIYNAPEPPVHLTLAGALAQREHAQKPRSQRRWLRRFQPVQRFPRRIVIMAASLTLAVLLTAGSVFAYPLIQHVFDPNPGLTQVVQNPLLYQDVNASQSVGGFTLKVTKAYADANKVVISYSVIEDSDPQAQVAYQPPKLTAKENMAFHPRIFVLSQVGTPLFTSFDILSAIAGNPGQLHLHLEVDGWQPVPNSLVTPSPGQPTPQPVVTVPQPITVDFAVPFHPGRVVNLHQAVMVHGKTLILERVVVTPSETRAYLRGDGYPLALDSIPTLTIGSWSSTQLDSSQPPSLGGVMIWPTDDHFPTNALLAVNFETSLMDKHGTWTLVVPSLLNAPYGEQSAGTSGPWIFHFVVP